MNGAGGYLMIKVTKQLHSYNLCFDSYPVFQLFIHYARQHTNYDLYVDDLIDPKTIIMHVEPAYLLCGKVNNQERESILKILTNGSWIVSPDATWDTFLKDSFKDHLQSFPRLLFDGSSLSIEHLKSLRKPLPHELKIVPIEQKHLDKGMIKEQIIDKFFRDIDFMKHGFGLALVNDQDIVHGFALTNYPIDHQKEFEVSYRVGYDDYQLYRNRGIGTTLVSQFLEESLLKGYSPVWDAANPISMHIAQKLGYKAQYHWNMHHII